MKENIKRELKYKKKERMKRRKYGILNNLKMEGTKKKKKNSLPISLHLQTLLKLLRSSSTTSRCSSSPSVEVSKNEQNYKMLNYLVFRFMKIFVVVVVSQISKYNKHGRREMAYPVCFKI